MFKNCGNSWFQEYCTSLPSNVNLLQGLYITEETSKRTVHVRVRALVCLFKRSNETLLQFWAQRAAGLKVMQMSPEIVEFPFNGVPDNIQCLQQAAWKWNNETELLVWYDRTLKGERGWRICRRQCHYRSRFLRSNWFLYWNWTRASAPPFSTVPNTSITRDTSDVHFSIWWSHVTQKAKKGDESPSLLGDTSQSRAQEDGKKRSRLLCEQGDRSHAYSPFISPTASGHSPPPCISLTNDRDAMARRSQMAIWLRSRHVSDLHLNHALIASDDFLTKKKEKEKQGQDTVGLNLEAPPPAPTLPSLPTSPPHTPPPPPPPLSACHELQFTVSLFKVKMKIGARSICIWTKREGSRLWMFKCNFYYTSIILLLITDSFSLCSSSKTRSYSRMHKRKKGGRKKTKLARIFEMFNL